MNELLLLLLVLLLDELAIGLRVLQAYTHTHRESESQRERYRFNSLHFIGFIQLAWPTTFTLGIPSTNEACFSGTFWKVSCSLSTLVYLMVQITKRITLARQSFCECCVKQAHFYSIRCCAPYQNQFDFSYHLLRIIIIIYFVRDSQSAYIYAALKFLLLHWNCVHRDYIFLIFNGCK